LWENNQIKNVIFWFFSYAFTLLIRVNTIQDESYFFKTALKDNFKLIVLIQFITSVYTFSLIAEMIFVPFMALLGGLLAVAGLKSGHVAVGCSKSEYDILKNLLDKIFGILGLAIICFTFYKLFMNFGDFIKDKTYYDFVVPTLLSILILPYFYFLSTFLKYENIFFMSNILRKTKNFKNYAKYKMIVSFRFDAKALKRWASDLSMEDIKCKADIDKSIKELKQRLKIEKNPPKIDPSE